jgi:hypothetical protein
MSPDGTTWTEVTSATVDMSRMVGLKNEGALLHPGNPVVGNLGRVQKSTRPLNPRQACRDGVCDGEPRSEAHGNPLSFETSLQLTVWGDKSMEVPAIGSAFRSEVIIVVSSD